MKRNVVKILIIFSLVLGLVALGSCEEEPKYKMAECSLGDLEYSIPSHFEYGADPIGEAKICYSTLSASICVYMYTAAEIDEIFPTFTGEKNANDFAYFLVERGGYDVGVDSNGYDRATYDVLHTPDGVTYYYYNNALLSVGDTVYMVAMSCPDTMLDAYADMFYDVIQSIKAKDEVGDVIG